jgi:repressor LexA
MKSLTQRQQDVLAFIRQTIDRGGLAPTLREIAAHFRFRSVKAAADHVTALRRKGALTGTPRRARSLRITDRANGGWATVRALGRQVARLPVYGSIPAGPAQDRRQEARGCVAVDLETLGIRPTPRTFALEVRGDSMIGRHIIEGDLVVLEHGKAPRSGDVVAALIDNESTLKTFVQERGQPPCLKAENPRYPKLHPAAELVIQGVMVGLIRKVKGAT